MITKIQRAINDKFTAGTNLKGKKATIGIVDGDIRITDSSRLSTGAILMAAPSSGTTPFGVGIVPAVGVLEAPVAAKLPDDVLYDKETYTQPKNSAGFMTDNGKGVLSGGGGSGTINYDSGAIDFISYPNSEFVVSSSFGSAMAGNLNADYKNVISEIRVHSANPKLTGKVNLVVGG